MAWVKNTSEVLRKFVLILPKLRLIEADCGTQLQTRKPQAAPSPPHTACVPAPGQASIVNCQLALCNPLISASSS